MLCGLGNLALHPIDWCELLGFPITATAVVWKLQHTKPIHPHVHHAASTGASPGWPAQAQVLFLIVVLKGSSP